MSEYFQVFLYDISLFSDDSFFFFDSLFLTTISTNTNTIVFLFSNNLLSVGYFVVFSGLQPSLYFLVQPGLFQEQQNIIHVDVLK